MVALKFALAALTLVASRPAGADPLHRWQPYIAEASVRFAVPAAWIERVIGAESAGRTRLHGRPITSRAGAMGLMQLMPATWAEMRTALGLGGNPHDPRDNIFAGTFYLRLMYDRFGYPGLFAAYNAGPARYTDHLESRRAQPLETRAYLRQVAGKDIEPATAARPPLFYVLSTSGEPTPSPIFVPLSTTTGRAR